ncbi:branched-chain amino acid ABC transporter permease/ATP-binding protein [Nocardioides endophyticus]|uniref:Branched-chain amino acid ABC transporter permease/ATP-binding protein n=1 Tax=Nocardioides endophyticus TaxID=1353775 RepID=A0ABP8ZCJ0_9ACTN
MEIFRFALLGLGIGALYAMCAQGIVLIYRASGVVNFAQGAFVLVGGYTYYELTTVHMQPTAVALVGVVALAAAVGVLTHFLLMRPLRNSSPLARTVATLGVLSLLQSIAVLRYKHSLLGVETILPRDAVDVFGATITQDRIILFGIGAVVTLLLWAVYRFTKFGQITAAVSENEQAAASMGHSPDLIAALNWGVGAGLAGLTGALIAQITFLEPNQLTALVLPALAAALLGGFSSYPLAFVAALGIGSAQSVLTMQVAEHDWWTGWPQALPFLAVICYLVLRGRGIPQRSHIFDRLPKVGTGKIRIIPTLVLFVVALAIALVLSDTWVIAFTATVTMAIVCLSVLVVTGYAGQLSLAQYVIGAMGAFVAAKLMETQGTPFAPAFLLGVVSAMLIGAVLGAPALRTRGVNLAVTTLGLGVTMYALFLSNTKLVGSIDGIPIKSPSILGIDIAPGDHPRRYAVVAIVALLLLVLAVANLRRGVAGRRLLAVRSNERAALALGVSVYTAKLYAFMLSAGIAAVGVSALAFMNDRVVFARFDVFSSIAFVTATVVGGVGMLVGPLIGSTLFDNSILSRFLSQWGTADEYMPLIGAISVLLVLVMGSDGIFEQNRQLGVAVRNKLRARRGAAEVPGPIAAAPERERVKAEPVVARTLTVRDLTVRFGGVVAVSEMNLTVRPGTVHGLIGPNGAGKTTFIDAVTGFVKSTGSVEVEGVEVSRLGARKRARRGVARSFQSGELFDDLTVRENLAVGSDESSWHRYVTDLFWPGPVKLSPAAIVAAQEFDLDRDWDQLPESLPFGRRRLVAIARAVASAPSVLLLDEPASGLDDDEARELAHLIRRLADDWGIAILLVEHNLEMVLSVCDEITVMAQGKELLAASPPDVVRTHPAVIEAYVGTAEDSLPGTADLTPA